MRRASFRGAVVSVAATSALTAMTFAGSATGSPSPVPTVGPVPDSVTITPEDCSSAVLGESVEAADIGEPTTGATLTTFNWSMNPVPYCDIRGAIHPVDPAAPPINFRVSLPATWTHRAVQYGGAGLNGSVVNTTGNLAQGWAGLGSDSGHSFATPNWPANEESVKNFGYMQLKKTHDVAWEVIERAYGSTPVYSYFFGSSQGGREGLTVAQRYPEDYDGVSARVPVVGFSTLMLEFVILRQQEIPLENWVTPAKANAIAAEIMRQCDTLDFLADGVINNYAACRANFDPDEKPNHDPWRDKRCPGGVDPDPADTSVDACLTDGQISTLETTYSKYEFTSPLAHGTTSHGFAVPSVDVLGSAFRRFIVPTRYAGQEGAAPDAPTTSWNAAPVILGTLFEDLGADPLDYVEGDPYFEQRRQLASEWLDSTDPDLTEFHARGGKLLVTVGAADNTAASGAQLDYYESVLDFMGANVVSEFARFWVVPQGGHGLSGSNASVNGYGEPVPGFSLPSSFDQNGALVDWVENGVAPPLHPIVSSNARSWPLCSYPMYPRYDGRGAFDDADSYRCMRPVPADTPLTGRNKKAPSIAG